MLAGTLLGNIGSENHYNILWINIWLRWYFIELPMKLQFPMIDIALSAEDIFIFSFQNVILFFAEYVIFLPAQWMLLLIL